MRQLEKKTLIITSWAPPMVGGPQNLYNLFSQIDKDSYFILTSYHAIFNSLANGSHGSWLKGEYHFFDSKKTISKKWTFEKEKKSFKSQNNAPSHIKNSYLYNVLIKNWLMPLLVIYLFSKKAIVLSKKKNIDCFVGVSDIGHALLATLMAHKITKKPYALYFFDIYKENVLPGLYKPLAKIFERPLIKNSKEIIVTNEKTKEFFEAKYGPLPITVINNSGFKNESKEINIPKLKKQTPFTIVFTGNISWPQEQSLMNLIRAVDMIPEANIQLHLYIPNIHSSTEKKLFRKHFVYLKRATASEMPRIHQNADLLFLPLSWVTKGTKIIMTASPGKLTDYLISGTLMLVHAPAWAYISSYVKKKKLGLVVDQNSSEKLAQTLKLILSDKFKSSYYIKNAYEEFLQNYDAKKNALKLTGVLKRL